MKYLQTRSNPIQEQRKQMDDVKKTFFTEFSSVSFRSKSQNGLILDI